jgi:hypothetical protein
VFTRASKRTLSWARWVQFTPSNPISLRSIVTLSSHLYLGLLSSLFPSGFPTKLTYAFPITMPATRPDHLLLIVFIILITDNQEQLRKCNAQLAIWPRSPEFELLPSWIEPVTSELSRSFVWLRFLAEWWRHHGGSPHQATMVTTINVACSHIETTVSWKFVLLYVCETWPLTPGEQQRYEGIWEQSLRAKD